MKNAPSSAVLFLLPFLLAACTAAGTDRSNVRWEELLHNPLYAERYWSELTEKMVNIHLREPDVLKDPQMRSIVDDVRTNALRRAQEASLERNKGKRGPFNTVADETTGVVLLLDRTLYFSSDFHALPGPSLRIYLSAMADPRDAAFPDATSVEIGRLESPYGAQEYLLPAILEKPEDMRSVVLYDPRLKRLSSFAQL
ncbi:MAG: hypothetical protein PHW10_03665 [Candidatus Peribacteraceae bacterium]|nr:hypothetical protein [Candidatus Peribacteraceae bacterium]